MFLGCSSQSKKVNSKEKLIPTKKRLDSIRQPKLIKSLSELKISNELKSYSFVKTEIEKERRELANKNAHFDSLKQTFKTSLVNKIFPFWEGTEWSFNGHTSVPKVGTIACGYFVSTTLQHIGLKLNRYKLAQQSPINEAKSLALKTEVKEFSENAPLDNIIAINKYLENGIHFIGFDQGHVGFILKEKDGLFLIHSNYVGSVGVEIERIEQSEVFKSYDKFYIVKLSTNKNLIDYWVKGKEIKVITE